ncbi:ML3, partial [Symbiodinium microadriaticum]
SMFRACRPLLREFLVAFRAMPAGLPLTRIRVRSDEAEEVSSLEPKQSVEEVLEFSAPAPFPNPRGNYLPQGKGRPVREKPRHPSKADTPLTLEEAMALFTDDKTTVMVRNVPNRYSCEEFLCEVISEGFEGRFNFFYLPIDFNTKRNRGYCFLNFLSAASAREFAKVFHGQKLKRYDTRKILEIVPAVTQGLEKNMKALKGGSGRVKNQWFRPMVSWQFFSRV